jgi:hypothetical protein
LPPRRLAAEKSAPLSTARSIFTPRRLSPEKSRPLKSADAKFARCPSRYSVSRSFAIFRLEVEPVQKKHLLDFVAGKHPDGVPLCKISHPGEGRSRSIRVRHKSNFTSKYTAPATSPRSTLAYTAWAGRPYQGRAGPP